jgi:hypothetical protein
LRSHLLQAMREVVPGAFARSAPSPPWFAFPGAIRKCFL